MKECEFCGEEFEPYHHMVKYCDGCRHKYDEYLDDTIRTGSRGSYFSHLVNLEKWLIEEKDKEETLPPLSNLEKRDVKQYVDMLVNRGEASSANTFISVLQSYADWMLTNHRSKWIEEGGMEQMHIEQERWERIASIKRPSIEETAADFITMEELETLLNVAYENNKEDFELIWLLAWMGCRPGELHDAYRRGQIIKIQSEKTRDRKTKRRIGVDSFTADVFDNARKHGMLDVTRQTIQNRVKGGSTTAVYDEALGIHITPKMFRHTFATYMDKRCIRDNDIMEHFDIQLDDKFTKIWQGHKVGKDITHVYREYPDDLFVYIAENKHYMLPLEKQFKEEQ